jgi:hypothetical protein
LICCSSQARCFWTSARSASSVSMTWRIRDKRCSSQTKIPRFEQQRHSRPARESESDPLAIVSAQAVVAPSSHQRRHASCSREATTWHGFALRGCFRGGCRVNVAPWDSDLNGTRFRGIDVAGPREGIGRGLRQRPRSERPPSWLDAGAASGSAAVSASGRFLGIASRSGVARALGPGQPERLVSRLRGQLPR